MKAGIQRWHLIVALAVVCGSSIAILHWTRSTRYDAARLLQCLPQDRAVKLYVDVDQLRAGGVLEMLAGSPAVEEPDYRKFVEETGFDYRNDVSAVAASFLHGDVYLTVRGRFEWKQLSRYAQSQKGQCRNTICSMPASTANRNISFFPINSEVLAWAISADERGVQMIAPAPQRATGARPSAPVWISAPGFAFADLRALPPGVRSFLSPLEEAQEAEFSAAAAPGGLDKGFEIHVDAACASPQVADKLARKFTATTELLRSMIERQHMKPNPGDLSGLLVAGRFEARQSHMTGSWPVDARLLQSLLSGKAE